ncbi:hypothetical protein [Jatrophihabitans sp. GAS493]|uniref:hypothetical protein n=1 Tax=Jatrophihabitans sp. GAS493 TaxID=1907575 RepID=UPI0012FD5388|nr:hypothetical protein [Jatrophihabitans sp. GAS493]
MAVTPLQAGLDVLDRAGRLLTLDPGTEQVSLLQYDIRRQSVAMAVAALDTWMHWSIRRVDLRHLSRILANVDVPFGELVGSGNRSVEARRQGVDDRPLVRARNTLNERILGMTFQSARQWETGFAMLGVAKGLARAAAAMTPPETRSAVEERLNRLSHRRNKIVHEGDLMRMMRPQRIKREVLSRGEVDDDVAWVRRFLIAVDAIS